MKIIKTERIPIYLWTESIEKQAMTQIKNIANHPLAFKHIAIMPDAHMGYGMPIGGVMAVRNAVIPNAVGVDIGCGMCAVKTSVKSIDKETLKKIVKEIGKAIPVGFSHHKTRQDPSLMPEKKNLPKKGVVNNEFSKARTQVGTLGGGNHFIEIQRDKNRHVWLMIHSGSRNIGFKVAKHYNKTAESIMDKKGKSYLNKQGLAYLEQDTLPFQNYLKEMHFCLDFAFKNRELMMKRVKEIFEKNVKVQVDFEPMINIAHNFASYEQHFDKMVYVHRKGSTQAFEGQTGIIPGSQGTNSYVVEGKGNPLSFKSCSHGAGRVMSRNKAKKTLDLKYERQKLEKKNILHSIRRRKDLDEASSAYKDIENVISDQRDLINVVEELTPLAVVKG